MNKHTATLPRITMVSDILSAPPESWISGHFVVPFDAGPSLASSAMSSDV
jgi:hypothetical protein